MKCYWVEKDRKNSGRYETDCDHSFPFEDGTLETNGFRYCCFCGNPITEVPFEDEPEVEECS